MNGTHYANAPIVEAIIDIQVRYKQAPSMDLFRAYQGRMADRFPDATPIRMVQMSVSLEPGGSSEHQTGQSEVGLRMTSKTGDRVLQLQQRGFSYSHMPPYSEWEAFEHEARELWNVFLEVCEPVAVNRSAVRFINRVNIPQPVIELSDYFHLYPNIPGGVQQQVSGMFMQLQMPQMDLAPPAMAIVNLALAEPALPGYVSVLLDFDVFRVAEADPTSEAVWQDIGQFRLRKNQLFEACITDKTRELIS